MSTNEPIPALGEDDVRTIINQWSDKGFFRLKNMGEKVFIQQILSGAAYTIRLQTHYEERNVKHAQVAYHGGPVDDRGRPPSPWDISIRQPQPFEEKTEKVPVPHTDRVQTCPTCAGEGRVTCPTCNGRRERTCLACAGRGFVEVPILDPGNDANRRGEAPGASSAPSLARRPCTCSGGMVRCDACSGNGVQVCSTCSGSGQVKTFDQLVVRFQAATQGEILDVTPVPDPWLGKLSGQILVDDAGVRIEQFDSVTPEVDRKAHDLLSRSHAVDEEHSRILQQTLQIQRIPLYEVSYKYAGSELKLWICGKEHELYAHNAPWHRQRLFLLLGGLAVGMAILAGLLVWLMLVR